MATLLVGYDLKKPGQDYSKVWAFLKSSGTWWHNLDSTWILVTSLKAIELRDRMLSLIDQNDRVLVVDITGADWASWISTDANAWLRDHVNQGR